MDHLNGRLNGLPDLWVAMATDVDVIWIPLFLIIKDELAYRKHFLATTLGCDGVMHAKEKGHKRLGDSKLLEAT